ncbi:MAG: CehA/McbA family metallohydrolase [Bryobacterales bacterium]|nr:CehA/McbA family metallohydrolase [Bryobacterales bacterium]
MTTLVRPLALSLLVTLVLVVVKSGPPGAETAAGESLPWGATEPAWSPDGERLAFSLFGSIWTAPAEGGTGTQITSSGGYHDHPAWSPDGQSIAFVKGENPRGRFAKIQGSLVIANVATGAERVLEFPYSTSGAPDWSPDGNLLYCPLLVPNAGALVYAVDADSGQAKPLHTRPQRGPAGPWAEVSSAPDEIVFTGVRTGAPQVWSLPTHRQGFMIQLPLTRYLPEHIVALDGIGALPDGGAVYSADVINGRGNFELYRVPRNGGEPVALTNTPRHELSPDVSPDGSRIAFASNQLGNIDLFTLPSEGGDARHVVIDGLEFRAPSGRVHVNVLDEFGNPTAARLYVEASDGKGYSPRGEPIFYFPLGTTTSREAGRAPRRDAFFVTLGTSEFDLPAGRLQLTAVKGNEYRLTSATVDVSSGNTTEVSLQLERWTNWNQRGWYSGENHFHANYLGSYYQRPPQSLAWLKAMDLNAANMIVANAQGAFVHDKEFFTGDLSPLSTERHFLYWGQEYRNSDPLGHMGFLNINKLVPPSYTSVIGSDSPYDFPLNTMAAIKARDQGGLVTYMHPIGGSTRDVFDTNLGAKESVVTAALGALDTLDVLPYADAAYELWYTLLNCGLRVAAGAGTDAFTNWRGINRIPGGSRQYVHVGGAMSWDRWIERYREGRSFATTGPLLTFEVNGSGMGEEIRFAPGTTYRATLRADVMSRTPIERVEFIQNGRVVESADAGGNDRFRLEKEVRVTDSSWFAARVYGPAAPGLTTRALAHSSAVYVTAGSKPVLVREDLDMAVRWIDRFWAYLVERNNFGSQENREAARNMVEQARRHYLDKLGDL